MNQGIAFARTLRALDADDFRASKLCLLGSIILLAGWTWWMMAARVPQYATTSNVRIETRHALAFFPPDAATRIQPGQRAQVRLDNITLPALVQSVAADHAELVFTTPQSPVPNPTRADASIEVSRVSPATIALRTLGRGSR